jgi:anti-sigma regulatory factor (Ser/Thr protein kinase)
MRASPGDIGALRSGAHAVRDHAQSASARERDPERAIAEIKGVEQISREALAEVRKAVSGYRTEGLTDEVANAERVLLTAGITPEIAVAPAVLPPEEDHALAFALREAVTNVVRHAGATHCFITLAVKDGRPSRCATDAAAASPRAAAVGHARALTTGPGLDRNGSGTPVMSLPTPEHASQSAPR